jgi:exodeoxyribonuclease VII small subunit
MAQEDDSKLTYSQAVQELDEIVAKMQSSDCSIDDLSAYTARSLALLKICKEKLTKTDEELKKILAELDDSKQ